GNEGGADCQEADDDGHHTQGEEEPPGVAQTRVLLGRRDGGGGCEWKAHGVSLLVLNRSFPDCRSLKPPQRLQELMLPTRRNGGNDFPLKNAAGSRVIAA